MQLLKNSISLFIHGVFWTHDSTYFDWLQTFVHTFYVYISAYLQEKVPQFMENLDLLLGQTALSIVGLLLSPQKKAAMRSLMLILLSNLAYVFYRY